MDAYLGEIRPFGFNFAPRGWAQCNGQVMSISQNTALFSLLGTSYGGNGTSTFALPNLQSRAPIHWDNSNAEVAFVGQTGGAEMVTLLAANLPIHSHNLSATTAAATTQNPSGAIFASPDARLGPPIYEPGTLSVGLAATTLTVQGSNIPFSIMQPSLVVNYCIATSGIFPSRS